MCFWKSIRKILNISVQVEFNGLDILNCIRVEYSTPFWFRPYIRGIKIKWKNKIFLCIKRVHNVLRLTFERFIMKFNGCYFSNRRDFYLFSEYLVFQWILLISNTCIAYKYIHPAIHYEYLPINLFLMNSPLSANQ